MGLNSIGNYQEFPQSGLKKGKKEKFGLILIKTGLNLIVWVHNQVLNRNSDGSPKIKKPSVEGFSTFPRGEERFLVSIWSLYNSIFY